MGRLSSDLSIHRRIPQVGAFTCWELLQKQETQNKEEDQISTPHPQIMPNPSSFRTLEDFFMIVFLEKVILYGEVAIKSTNL